MNISQQSALKASGILGCIRRGVAKRLRKVTLSSALVWTHLEYCVWFWALQHNREMEISERVHRTEVHPEHEETRF